jgi:hypothetical protein
MCFCRLQHFARGGNNHGNLKTLITNGLFQILLNQEFKKNMDISYKEPNIEIMLLYRY